MYGALAGRKKLVRGAFFLISIFHIIWAIVSAAQGYYDYGFAVAGYGIWAFSTFVACTLGRPR